MQPDMNLSLFSSHIGYNWEKKNLSDSPSIWVSRLSASVHVGRCLIIYTAWNWYGKDRVPVRVQWFIMCKIGGTWIFYLQPRLKHQAKNCWVMWEVKVIWNRALFFQKTLCYFSFHWALVSISFPAAQDMLNLSAKNCFPSPLGFPCDTHCCLSAILFYESQSCWLCCLVGALSYTDSRHTLMF